MHTNLVVDLNNVASNTRHGKLKNPPSRRQKEPRVVEFLFKEVLTNIVYTAKKVSAKSLVITADSKGSWRRDMVYPLYKLNREDDSYEDIYYEETIKAVDMLCEFFQENTAAVVLKMPKVEADDIIATWCVNSDAENIIMSTDSDFVQLLQIPNTELYNYRYGKQDFIEVEDPDFELFLKCIRGDKTDNVPSAFPRVRRTRLLKCWEDDLEMLNLLNEKVDESVVGDLLERNMALISLFHIPQSVTDQITSTISEAMANTGKYDEMRVLRYFGKIGLGDFTNLVTKNAICFSTKPRLK